MEIKYPFNGKDFKDPKTAFLLHSINGIKDGDGNFYLDENYLYCFQGETYTAAAGLNISEFVTYTSKGIHAVIIHFNANFWETVVIKVLMFYC